MKLILSLISVVLVIAAIIAGCKSDNNTVVTPPTTTGSTTYVGTLANASETGSLTLIFSSAVGKRFPATVQNAESIITVSGSIKIGATTILLTGTYNTANDSLVVSGGGYTFQGKLSGGHISGSYTGPHGDGNFFASPSTSEGSVKVYCGTYHETSPDTSVHGRFNLVISGTTVSGIDDNGTKLGGSVSGTTVTVTIEGIPIATGTINGTSISGTYSVPSDPPTSGTWEASICQ